MHFLKKMSAVAIMLMAGLSGQGCWAVYPVEFPNIPGNPALQTPGYIGIVQHNVGGVMIPRYNPPNSIPPNYDRFIWIQVPNANNANIYFPVDGRQPTTQEAAEWSCANIGANNPNAPVTEWYMRMFGWTDPTVRGQVPLQMGFAPLVDEKDREVEPKPIISINRSIFNFIPYHLHKRKFWEIFRQIASNPVGRTLLYRLLIEIRRITPTGRNGVLPNSGDVENDLRRMNGPDQIQTRNNCRSITIFFDNEFLFDVSHHLIKIFDGTEEATIFSINSKGKIKTERLKIISYNSPPDVCLFHEMLHWFHELRNPQRHFDEHSPRRLEPTQENYLARVYLGDPISPRINEWGDEIIIECEEIRTILGSPNVVDIGDEKIQLPNGLGVVNKSPVLLKCYCNGDDLSENAYRASLKLSMRWGHYLYLKPSVNVDFELGALLSYIPRYRMAHWIAQNCCNDIVTANGRFNNTVSDWEFRGNEAICVE